MPLAPGIRLGSYEVLSPLGAGGMGEVYRARDTRLGREVAIKVLPAAFAADHDRMVRFQREAHVLASLNHPNIAAIFGFEESNSTRALVMELVEGPTLQERIGQQEAEMKALQADKLRMQTKVTELTRTVEEMTAQTVQMQQTNNELKTQVDQLTAALAEADARAKAKAAPKTSSPMKRKR